MRMMMTGFGMKEEEEEMKIRLKMTTAEVTRDVLI